MPIFTRKNILILLFFCFSFLTLKSPLYATEDTTLFVPEQEDSLSLPFAVPSLRSPQTTNWFLSDIGAPDAYASIPTAPTKDIIVAVIDTGVDYTHSAFTNALWMNESEQNGEPGVDDDHNGYIDDIYGYNFRNNTSDPMDNSTGSIQGHGTHIAHTIVRTANVQNGENPFRIKIMCLKAGDAYGNFSAADVIQAVNYAIENGASVINLSIATTKNNLDLKEALKNASLSAVIVAAAGNKGVATSDSSYSSSANYYPAGYPFVAGIMAYTPEHTLASFSNWDFEEYTSVNYECAAPGTDIYAAAPDGQYKLMSGTSMSTAIASGAAALLWAKYGDLPNMTPQTLTARLMYAETATIPFTDAFGNSYHFRKLHLPALLAEPLIPSPVISSIKHQAEEQILSVTLLNRQCAAKTLSVTLSFPANVNLPAQSIHYDSFAALEEITAAFNIPWEILTGEDLPLTLSYSFENGLCQEDVQTYTETYTFSINNNGIEGNPKPVIPLKGITLPASPMYVSASSSEKLAVSLIPENTTEDRTLTYTSSAPEIISIDETGNFTAHRTGQAVLTVTASNGLHNSVTVFVLSLPSDNNNTENTDKESRLKPPTITKIKRTGTSRSPGLQLQWKQIPSASGYVIYRKKGANGSWKKMASVSSKKLCWTDRSCKTNTTYYYRVKALGNKKSEDSSYALSGKVVLPKKVQKVSVTRKKQKLQISFEKQAKVSGYEIYISTKKTGTYKKLKSTDSCTRITLKNPFPKKKIYLKVRAYYKTNSKTIYGPFSRIQSL